MFSNWSPKMVGVLLASLEPRGSPVGETLIFLLETSPRQNETHITLAHKVQSMICSPLKIDTTTPHTDTQNKITILKVTGRKSRGLQLAIGEAMDLEPRSIELRVRSPRSVRTHKESVLFVQGSYAGASATKFTNLHLVPRVQLKTVMPEFRLETSQNKFTLPPMFKLYQKHKSGLGWELLKKRRPSPVQPPWKPKISGLALDLLARQVGGLQVRVQA